MAKQSKNATESGISRKTNRPTSASTPEQTRSPAQTSQSQASGGSPSTGTAVAEPQSKAKKTTRRNPTPEEIQARAYEIYLARHGAPGDPEADWLEAERQLREGSASK